jgi:hypothetical protein
MTYTKNSNILNIIPINNDDLVSVERILDLHIVRIFIDMLYLIYGHPV